LLQKIIPNALEAPEITNWLATWF